MSFRTPLNLRSYKRVLPRTRVFLFAVRNCARLRTGASIDIHIDMSDRHERENFYFGIGYHGRGDGP
jgi:hypothetical protein